SVRSITNRWYQVELATEPLSRQPVPLPTAQAAVLLVTLATFIIVVASSEAATPVEVSITVCGLVPSFESARPPMCPCNSEARLPPPGAKVGFGYVPVRSPPAAPDGGSDAGLLERSL